MSRKAAIKTKGSGGSINRFIVSVDGKIVISAEGSKGGTWKGSVGDAHVSIKARVMGVDDADYDFTLSLADSIDEQTVTFSLSGGFHEFELIV